MVLPRFVITATLVTVFLFTGSQVAAGQCTNTAYLNSTQLVRTFYSPGYPAKYSSNEDCSWLITAPSDQRVLLYFASFQLEDHKYCSYDSVSIYDGANSYFSSLLAKKCGSEIPLPIYSSGRYLLVTFRSDSSVSYRGFVAKFSSLTNSSDCPSTVSGNSTGVIYSPGFPWSYPNNKQCSWYIRAPYGRVNLTFTTFKLDPFSCSDYVDVTNGHGTLISRKCGRYFSPFTIVSTGNTVQVRFVSSSTRSYQGFMAFYQTGVSPTTPRPYTDWSTTHPYYWRSTTHPPYYWWSTTHPPYYWWSTTHPYYWWSTTPYWLISTRSPAASYACQAYSGKVLMVDSSSSIASPNYPGSLSYFTVTFKHGNPVCSWQVVTKDKDYLELTFDDMSISSCGSYRGCYCGKVEVREGYQHGKPLGTFCRGETLKVSSEDNSMFIAYYPSVKYDKFKATIRAKNKGVSAAAVVVPLVVGLVLFGIIFAVIICTKKIPSTGQPATSSAFEVPLQTFAPQQDSFQPPQGEVNAGVCINDGTGTA